MATKSILKNVDIRDPKLAKSLVVALENATERRGKNVVLNRTYSDIRGQKIHEIFGNRS